MTSPYLIYALVDPRSKRWRYIGKSCRGLKRPADHGRPGHLARAGNSHKANWIRQLHAQRLDYEIEVLEELALPVDLYGAEEEWISEARRVGIELTNKTDGGPGVLGLKHSLVSRAKMSEAKRGRSLSQGHRDRIGDSLRGRRLSPAEIARVRLQNVGQVRSAATREKLSQAKSRQWSDPAFVKKNSERHGGRTFVDENGTPYFSYKMAADALGIHPSAVYMTIKGRRSHASGHTFRYLD